MSTYFFGARKRNLSSDTTESSDNEEEQAGKIAHAGSFQAHSRHRGSHANYNRQSRGLDGLGQPAAKSNRFDSWSNDENEAQQSANHESSHSESGEEDEPKNQSSGTQYSNMAQKLMANMGYVEGRGLGKHQQGRVNIIETSKQRGRRGLGLQLTGLDANEAAEWNPENDKTDEIPVPEWIPSCRQDPPTLDEMEQWFIIGKRKETIDDETTFCEPATLQNILSSKTIFDHLGTEEFLKARTRSNPYETIRGGIFQNRAAMKAAEMDASFDFMFTDPKDASGKSLTDSLNLLYFADICAGPGGFSEYVFWRKKWHSKGYGLTLRADGANDFKINDFMAGSPETFEPYYGVGGYEGDGDIFREDNLIEFRRFVMENTDNKGVHFVMADGGFSVEGQENIQEILSKQLYICQFLCALSILRTGGHFFCKLFDIFTPFSVGCLYLLYRAFDQICIFKPVTSRPANSERYVVCKGKLPDANDIHDYMFNINVKLNELKRTDKDVNEVVPMDVIKDDTEFFEYIYESNNILGDAQAMYLLKLKTFVQNTNLSHSNQGQVRKDCLLRWKIPDEARSAPNRSGPEEKYIQLSKNVNIQKDVNDLTDSVMKQIIGNILDYKCCVSGGTRVYLLSLGRFHIFQWEPRKMYSEPHWKKLEGTNLELPRDTLIEAEIVPEFKGEGRGQRRVQAVHVIDAIYLGGDFIADKPFRDRMKYIEVFTKALHKPSRASNTILRSKQIYRLMDARQIFERMQMYQMKSRAEMKMCFSVDNQRYFLPTGLHFFRCVKGPWSLNHSKSQRKLYFFNRKTGVSSFESPGSESFADYEYCLSNRLHWSLDENDDVTSADRSTRLSKDDLLEIVKNQVYKLGLTS